MVFLYIEDIYNEQAEKWANILTSVLGKTFRKEDADNLAELSDPDGFSQYLQEQDVDLLFISVENNRRHIQGYLNACRSLRIPYIFLTDTMRKLPVLAHYENPLHEVLAPVTMFEEEVHKAELLKHFMRYTHCNVTLLQANDYGHKAETNVNKIRSFILSNLSNSSNSSNSSNLSNLPNSSNSSNSSNGASEPLEPSNSSSLKLLKAQKDSLSIHKELPSRLRDLVPDLMVVTASRDYGLDDLIFGPAERYILLHSQVPVALLNPRGDLFSLCD